MEKDNVKENETEVNTDEKEENSVELSKEHEENTNNELQDLIEDHEEVDSKESNKPSFGKEIFANLLDQFVILAGSSVILLILARTLVKPLPLILAGYANLKYLINPCSFLGSLSLTNLPN